jgi:hypothetical protein
MSRLVGFRREATKRPLANSRPKKLQHEARSLPSRDSLAQTLNLAYFSAVCTLPKVVFKLVPMPCTVAIITTAIPAAISP